jgi:hypothetical protein
MLRVELRFWGARSILDRMRAFAKDLVEICDQIRIVSALITSCGAFGPAGESNTIARSIRELSPTRLAQGTYRRQA